MTLLAYLLNIMRFEVEIFEKIVESNITCIEKAFIDLFRYEYNKTYLKDTINDYIYKILNTYYKSIPVDFKIVTNSYRINSDNTERKITKIAELYNKRFNKVKLLIKVVFSTPNFNLEYKLGMVFCKFENKVIDSSSPSLTINLPINNKILLNFLIISAESHSPSILCIKCIKPILQIAIISILKALSKYFFERF
jgi:hypothetical protein